MIGRPKWILRAEGAAVLLACLIIYGLRGYNWWFFLALLLVPDISMLGYLRNARMGSFFYNFGHTEIFPVLLGAAAVLYRPDMLAYPLIWLAHIGLDRMLGFGLKYPTHFTDTHLARV